MSERFKSSLCKRFVAALMLAMLFGVTNATVGSLSTAAAAEKACSGTKTGLGDPCGDETGNAKDIVGDEKIGTDVETVTALADATGKNKVAVNLLWTLIAGFLVMFMQAGFALVETGFCQKKNAAHVMMTNFMIYGIGILGFFLTGYAFMFGGYGGIAALGGNPVLDNGLTVGGWNLLGLKGFAFSGIYDVGIATHFLFNLVFMDTTATIVTGAMAERWKWSAFVVYGFFVSMVIYPVFGNWAWGGGWLAQLGSKAGFGHGYVDFAGSGVVHAVGGILALAGCVVIGPRLGKYRADGTPRTIRPYSIPMALLGTFILAFGWFGFNAGSTLAATDLRISIVAVNTMLAGAAGSVVAMLWAGRAKRFGKPDPGMCVNGMLAGLVAVTAPCAFIAPWAALVIGGIAGILIVESCLFFEKRGVDDPVGAISVHGIGGLFGVLSVGIFADGTYGAGWNGVDGAVKGLLYGDSGQIVAQLIGMITILVWAGGFGWVFFKVQHAVQGIRSKEADEIVGLDLPEMGVLAYNDEDFYAEIKS